MITEKIIKFAFNLKMQRYAYMLKLDINPEDKTIDLEVLLRGEGTPLQIHIGHYEILTGAESGIKVSQIHTSREWMTEMIQTMAPEHTVNFNYAKLLKIFM
jgi:hypothetical protein